MALSFHLIPKQFQPSSHQTFLSSDSNVRLSDLIHLSCRLKVVSDLSQFSPSGSYCQFTGVHPRHGRLPAPLLLIACSHYMCKRKVGQRIGSSKPKDASLKLESLAGDTASPYGTVEGIFEQPRGSGVAGSRSQAGRQAARR